MRVFTGALATETNTFAPMPTGLGSFRDRGYYPAGKHPDAMSFFAAPLWAARQRAKAHGWDLVEGMVAGGAAERHDHARRLRDACATSCSPTCAPPCRSTWCCSACTARWWRDGYDDCEGDLLAGVRAIVGPKVVVGAELDPHYHLTPAMLNNADLLVAFKEYPHTDVLERAYELVDLCAATVEKRIRPVAAVVDCEMLVTMHTSRATGARLRRPHPGARRPATASSRSRSSHGFAWGDYRAHGHARSWSMPTATKPRPKALARRLADELIGLREQLRVRYPSIDEALDEALAFDGGPVVLADGADNPGGGASGDSTFVLRRMLERGIGNAVHRPALGPGGGAHRLRGRRRRDAAVAHRRQDRPALGRPDRRRLHRQGSRAPT